MLTFSRKYKLLILTGESMIKDHQMIMQELNSYASPKAKLTRMRKAGELIQVRRGLFITRDDSISPYVLAPLVYGPSYLSFQFALSVHGLIPERVNAFTSASFHKNKQKVFHTPIGDFYYFYLPPIVYPHGVYLAEENGFHYLIATPEKAICDSVYKVHRKGAKIDIETLLLTDWRMERESLMGLDFDFVEFLAPLYGKRLLKSLTEWLSAEVRHA